MLPVNLRLENEVSSPSRVVLFFVLGFITGLADVECNKSKDKYNIYCLVSKLGSITEVLLLFLFVVQTADWFYRMYHRGIEQEKEMKEQKKTWENLEDKLKIHQDDVVKSFLG